MEITKARLKQIIEEEIEMSAKEDRELTSLMESYIEAYNDGVKKDTISKEAIVDFLDMLQEQELPIEIFESIVNSVSESKIKGLLQEVVER